MAYRAQIERNHWLQTPYVSLEGNSCNVEQLKICLTNIGTMYVAYLRGVESSDILPKLSIYQMESFMFHIK